MLAIKYKGNRPASVGGYTVPWKQWDTKPTQTMLRVQILAHADEMFNLLLRVKHTSPNAELEQWRQLKDDAARLVERIIASPSSTRP